MVETDENENKKKVKRAVLKQSLGGGPHGLGDPDDRSLRKVEKEILVAKLVRDRTREEKCNPEVEEFSKCCKDAQYAMVFSCRKQTAELKKCYEKWYKNDEFWAECTQQYLDERSEYRRTGVPKKVKDFKNRIANMM